MKVLMFLSNVDCIADCGGADILRIIKFIWTLLDLVLFVVPIGLIIMIMVDFLKNVIASKEDEMKKNANIVIKRIIYCVILFLVPSIVKFAISIVDEVLSDTINTKAFGCLTLAEEISEAELAACEVDYENFFDVPNDSNSNVESNNGVNNDDGKASVTFYANGGVITSKADGSTMNKYVKRFDKNCTAFSVSSTFSNSATIKRTNYTFTEWNTKADGSGITYDGTKKWDCSSNLNLYAQWKTKVEVSVTFHANGGVITSKADGSTMNKYVKRFDKNCTAFSVSSTFSNSAKIEKNGYTFTGWNTKADGSGTMYGVNKKWDCSSNLNLYAQWEISNEVSVTFYANGGVITSKADGSTMNKYVKNFDKNCSAFGVSATFSNSAKIEKNGSKFVGWNTKADGSGTMYKATTNWSCSSDLNLYAQWE